MAKIPQQTRTTQLILFGESFAVPQWHDLAEATCAEAVRLLAQLLVSVHAGNLNLAPCDRGDHDE
jgi:hypothetical protein